MVLVKVTLEQGGWGVYIIFNNSTNKELFGYEANTTNNRMELTAAIEALNLFKESQELVIFTDSNYVKQGITNWIVSWKINKWSNKKKKPIKNIDLWKKLDF